mgnify:CR=1 FL=1
MRSIEGLEANLFALDSVEGVQVRVTSAPFCPPARSLGVVGGVVYVDNGKESLSLEPVPLV